MACLSICGVKFYAVLFHHRSDDKIYIHPITNKIYIHPKAKKTRKGRRKKLDFLGDMQPIRGGGRAPLAKKVNFFLDKM